MGGSPGHRTGGARAARRARLWRVPRPRSAVFAGAGQGAVAADALAHAIPGHAGNKEKP